MDSSTAAASLIISSTSNSLYQLEEDVNSLLSLFKNDYRKGADRKEAITINHDCSTFDQSVFKTPLSAKAQKLFEE